MAGKTAGDLAEAIGRDPSVVSRILNDRQLLSLDHAKAFSDVLGVDTSEVLIRAGLTDQTTAQAFSPGFSDNDAAPWIGQSADRRGTAVAEALGARNGIDVWTIRTDAMAMAGYLPGDFMLVDTLQTERVKPGDIVVAQVYDRHGGARTVLRRLQPPILVAAAPPSSDETAYVVDNNNVVIRGRITASWRISDFRPPSSPSA